MISTQRRRARRNIEINQFLAMVGRIVAAAGRRTAEADADDLRALIDIREQLDDAIVEAVRGLRASGTTWEEIGAATGTTRQAAIMKWSKRV